MTSKTELKNYFKNGDVPNQEQFWSWMDSYWHKEELTNPDSLHYTNPEPTTFNVGGVPKGTTFDKMSIKDVLDYILYGKVEPSIEIKYKIRTTKPNESVLIAMIGTSAVQAKVKVNYGNGREDTLIMPTHFGSDSWTDPQGQTYYTDPDNTISCLYEKEGDYEVTITTDENVNYVRLCEGFIKTLQGELKPITNNFIIEISKFKSKTLTNLDYTFAGLSQANVSSDFKLETPEVTRMNSAFYGFGEEREFESFPSDMLSKITKPSELKATFFRAGLKKILPGFLDSFLNLETVWECFKYSKLGKGHYNNVDVGQYIKQAVEGTNDFIPVSLFWKAPKLKDISHCFNYIGEGWFGNLTSNYLAYNTIRRELFWNGKLVGNKSGTIKNAFYAFAKNNRILCEANLFKYCSDIVHLGGIFTQTNHMSHAVGWGGMIPVAAEENIIYDYRQSGSEGNYILDEVSGKGLTFDLNTIFPEELSNVLTINGAFTTAATGSSMGFQHSIDYRPNGSNFIVDNSTEGAQILKRFPNAKAGSVDSYAMMVLSQSSDATLMERQDGRNGAFYMLDQDNRFTDKDLLPALVFNNAIPY
jgi:hypothetical protein